MKNVSFSYQEEVLKSVSFRVNKGEVAFLTGKSGEGKTTIFDLLSGELIMDKGEIFIDNVPVGYENEKIIQKKVAQLSQPAQLMADKTVTENLSYYMLYHGESRESIEVKVSDLLEQLRLTSRATHFPEELSGGEQARLGLGLAIVKDSSVLLVDEPSASLDPVLSQHIIKLLLDLAEKGKTILISTHDSSLIPEKSKVIELSKGTVEVKE